MTKKKKKTQGQRGKDKKPRKTKPSTMGIKKLSSENQHIGDLAKFKKINKKNKTKKGKTAKQKKEASIKKQALVLMNELSGTPKKKQLLKTTPAKVAVAIDGTRGNKAEIARRLGVSYSAVASALQRDGIEWDLVRKMFDLESERIGDNARDTIEEMIDQRQDLGVAARTARWYLERRDKKFAKSETVKLEGGDDPIKIQAAHVIAVDSLELPLAMRRQLLLAMKKKEEDEKSSA